jgi:hypothetical protein
MQNMQNIKLLRRPVAGHFSNDDVENGGVLGDGFIRGHNAKKRLFAAKGSHLIEFRFCPQRFLGNSSFPLGRIFQAILEN